MTTDYNDNIKALATFSTVEDFWGVYNHLKRPDDLPPVTEYHIFRDDIKPVWEVWRFLSWPSCSSLAKTPPFFLFVQDEANASGGKWMIKLRKGLASRMWENLV